MMEPSLLISNTDGCLEVLQRAKIQIVCITKRSERKMAAISVGPKPNVYFALFPEDDVDFEITIDNKASKDRSLCVEMEIHKKIYSFVVRKNARGTLQTYESNGRKFHFLRQSSAEGEALVSTVAALHGMSFDETAVMISQIKFTTKYSKRERSVGTGRTVVTDSVMVDGGHHHPANIRKEKLVEDEETERGAICFGERSSQQFSKMTFDVDPTIVIDPFIIEMRMKSRFAL